MPTISGYPQPWGSVLASVCSHVGPASYAVLVVGTLASGGNELQGPEAGIKFFDFVAPGITDSGRFVVMPVPEARSGGRTGQQTRRYRLKWMSLVTGVVGGQAQVAGTEVVATTNLSGETVRLLVIAHK